MQHSASRVPDGLRLSKLILLALASREYMIAFVPPVTELFTWNARGVFAYAPARVRLTVVGSGHPEFVIVHAPSTASTAVSI
jgi:hypothetical protein